MPHHIEKAIKKTIRRFIWEESTCCDNSDGYGMGAGWAPDGMG
jgi:hypothetical protein